MNEIETLVNKYADQLKLWVKNLPAPQRVWFLIYDKTQERRLRLRLGDFEARTQAAGHRWSLVDLTNAFAEWMACHEYRDAYFEQPDAMRMELANFEKHVVDRVGEALTAPGVDNRTLVAVVGLGSLFGLVRSSDVLPRLEPQIPGRLLIFFPGSHDGPNYHLLDARDGWNYRAIPISKGVGE
jgi:hypothetical protein